MIGVSKLYCDSIEASDILRYGRHSSFLPSHLLQFSEDKRPVVVWNLTKRCNLHCIHCYARSDDSNAPQELSTQSAKAVIDDLADFGTPVLLFSGGEPFLRSDLFELVDHAVQKGIRAVISSNGTLINKNKARELASIGLSYVGISLDGTRDIHDSFRGVNGAFDKAMQGIDNCQEQGLKVGLRFTMNKKNINEISKIFDLLIEREIPRICFYHLVYSGRATALIQEDLDLQTTRRTMDFILQKTADLYEKNMGKEVLTVDNHADGPYIYLRLLRENPQRAEEVRQLLQFNGGNSSGLGIGCISWNGDVHADQFWREHIFGNVLQEPFSKIWSEPKNELLFKLKNKKEYIQGRCAQCRFLDVCAGNFRSRAEAYYGQVWAPDPACYLTDQEIGIGSL